jgi:hypothetical protein
MAVTLSEISVRVCDVVRKGGWMFEEMAPPHGGDRKSKSHRETLTPAAFGVTKYGSSRWQQQGEAA